MDENELVAAIREIVETPPAGSRSIRRIEIGIGDDAAVWQPSRSHLSVITSDTLVDGVHFLSERTDAHSIGRRAMASNLSDIAAMAARPVLATIALGVARETSRTWILDCYRGMHALAARHGVRIAGGDIVASPATTLGLTIVGEVSRGRLRRRSGGRPGDVTGPLGASRAGLELRRSAVQVAEPLRQAALDAFERPEPRLREGRWLGGSAHVHALMDCSDGLSTDVARLAQASGCGATLDAVPIHPAAVAVAAAAGADPLDYALDGGEDFELIAAVAPRAFAYLARRFRAHTGRSLLAAGRLEAEPGLRLVAAGRPAELVPAGFDHLR
jgi:thiamine-monophosphate kinase